MRPLRCSSGDRGDSMNFSDSEEPRNDPFGPNGWRKEWRELEFVDRAIWLLGQIDPDDLVWTMDVLRAAAGDMIQAGTLLMQKPTRVLLGIKPPGAPDAIVNSIQGTARDMLKKFGGP